VQLYIRAFSVFSWRTEGRCILEAGRQVRAITEDCNLRTLERVSALILTPFVYLTTWSRILLRKLLVSQLIKELFAIVDPKYMLPPSQEPAIVS
jgi:hypothetical protein